MLYRTMPKSKDELSILGYGCMRLPQKNGRIDKERAKNQIYSAIDKGVNYIDTAYPYHAGASESFLGEILQGEYRSKVKLATKLPVWVVHSREDMDKYLNKQLEKLKTDHIDYYLLHALSDKHTWRFLKNNGVFDFIEKAKESGKIINIGFSFHGNKNLFKEIIDDYDWDFCQIQYNFLDEYNQAGKEGLLYATSKNIGVIVMEPLRGGNLVGKIPNEVEKLWNTAANKKTPAEWALRWIWNHPEVKVVLSGMNQEEHIEENIRIAGEAYEDSLTSEELELVDKVKSVYRKLMKVPCTGCSYCMPCPAGVNIPRCFEEYNNKYLFDSRFPKTSYTFKLGGLMGHSVGYASLCIECGKCEKECPQSISIRDELKVVAKEFETRTLKTTAKVLKKFVTKK